MLGSLELSLRRLLHWDPTVLTRDARTGCWCLGNVMSGSIDGKPLMPTLFVGKAGSMVDDVRMFEPCYLLRYERWVRHNHPLKFDVLQFWSYEAAMTVAFRSERDWMKKV